MRFKPAGGFDLVTGALVLGGCALIALAIVVSVVLLAPPRSEPSPPPPEPTPTPFAGRASAALSADRVAAVLSVDAATGAAAAARKGDHIDVLGFFPQKATGSESVTRVLLADVPVLNVDRAGANVALTLSVPQSSALLLQEAQALGAQPYVTLRSPAATGETPSSFSDTDLANQLRAAGH